MRKYLAEFLGTFMLVFLGTGTVVVAKGDVLAIGLAFGLAITVSAYAFGEFRAVTLTPPLPPQC